MNWAISLQNCGLMQSQLHSLWRLQTSLYCDSNCDYGLQFRNLSRNHFLFFTQNYVWLTRNDMWHGSYSTFLCSALVLVFNLIVHFDFWYIHDTHSFFYPIFTNFFFQPPSSIVSLNSLTSIPIFILDVNEMSVDRVFSLIQYKK